jgi:hypothetical protein
MAIESPEHTEELDPRKLFLRNIWSLQDQQIHEVAQSYIRDVHTELITKADVLARAFAALVFISKHQIIAQSSETLLQIFLKVVDKFTLENRFTAEDIGGWDANSIFYSPLEPEVEELLAALTNARDQFLERQQERRVHSLFREFDTEYNTFLQRMGGKFDDDHFDYLHTPILARFDAQAFAEAIGRKSALDIRHFSELLNQRYLRVVNIADFLQEESAILIEMASQLRGKLLCMSPCMKRIAIEGVVGQLEQASIKLNPPNTQSEIPPFVNGV